MRAVLLSRYPRVDTAAWKRQVAEQLSDEGVELSVVYSRARLTDQLRAGIDEFGLGVASRYLSARRSPGSGPREPAQSLTTWAAERGVEVSLHRRLGDTDCLARLREAAPDLVILAGADIVPPAVLEIPRLGTLNAHYGLLPKYRGMNVTEWSIYHDDPVGVSVHWVDGGIDTGPVAVREPVAVDRGDTLADLRSKHQRTAARLLFEAARQALGGQPVADRQRPQDGRQYYRMHPDLRRKVELRLARGEYRWIGTGLSELEAALASEFSPNPLRPRPVAVAPPADAA